MFRKTGLLLCAAAIASCASAAATKQRAVKPAVTPPPLSGKSPALWAGLEPGPLPVGFKSWDMRLQAADFPRGPQHLIQMDVWYPIVPGTGTAMTFKDYVTPRFIETHYADPTADDLAAILDDFRTSLQPLGITAAAANRWLDSPVYARLNGNPPLNKLYPIIGIAPDAAQTLSDQAILGEYLASFGYVVVTSPSMTRFDPLTPDRTTALQDEQQDELDRVVSQIGYWPMTIDIPVSIVGYGFGADAAVLYAMHPKQPTNALVLIDPQFSADRIAAMKSAQAFDASYRLPAVLQVYTGTGDLTLLHSLNTAAGLTAQAVPMKHLDFTSMGFAAAALPEIANATGAEADIASKVRAAAQSVRTFIDRIWAPTRPPL